MAENDDGSLSSSVFIAVISSVGGVIFLIAIVMICAFTCLCYREYRRRSQKQRKSDRVGLLRSGAEEEDIVSDQDSEVVPMSGVKAQLGDGELPDDRVEKPALFAALSNGSKVSPEPNPTPPHSTPPNRKRSKKQHKGDKIASASYKKPKISQTQDVVGSSQAHTSDDDDDLVCTMIGAEESQVTLGDPASYELNAERDDSGDKVQLIHTNRESEETAQPKRESAQPKKESAQPKKESAQPKKESAQPKRESAQPKRESAQPEKEPKKESAQPKGSAQTQERKSRPLDANALAAFHDSEIALQYKGVPSNTVDLPDQSAAEKEKNRYRNVLPNPHSAVKLQYTGAEGSTYINANFIRGLHGKEKSYIAAQGPMLDTVPDFWRLVWEQNVSTIVMLTNLIENGRHKCAKYWPPANEKDKITYGNIEVTRIKEERVPSCYMLSHLSVKNVQTGEERTVQHFWCIAWPDFGIPKVAEPILKLREAVDGRRTSGGSGPIIVHCSAGLGRSGTFIAIDMGIEQYQKDGVVDPLQYLCEMRQDRGGMIQTQDQYKFVHQALEEYVN